MKISLGFSPCPNDTYLFDALVNGGIDTGALGFEPVLEDVQTLNDWAAGGRLHVTKLSFPALFDNLDKYAILDAGSALGRGVGPLLIARESLPLEGLDGMRIAVPGKNTTANFLLRFALPGAGNIQHRLFSQIEDAVLTGEADAGVIIHENRFTYAARGLVKLMDLGTHWESVTRSPIPLGCIAVRRDVPLEIQHQISTCIANSYAHAKRSPTAISEYVRCHAQAMDEGVMQQHIDLYVNEFTRSLGSEGRKAIEVLFREYAKANGLPAEPLQGLFAG